MFDFTVYLPEPCADSTPQPHPTYERAELAIDFLVVGGGLGGLSCALALRRVGHRVLVLEQFTDPEASRMSHGGIRLAPNVVKILYKWGLKARLNAISVDSRSFEVHKYDTGELLGTHVWDEDIFRETDGAFLLCHHADLRRLLLDAAVEAGADIRNGTKVVSIDCNARQVTLSTGAKLRADVIVGAEGCCGLIQQAIAGKCAFGAAPSQCLFYNTTVPVELMQRDPALADLCSSKHVGLWKSDENRGRLIPFQNSLVWLGHNAAVTGFYMGGTAEYALHIWVQSPRNSDRGDECFVVEVAPKELRKQLGICEPRLLKLAAIAQHPARIQVKIMPPLENWVHHGGRVLIIGEAAHPLPAGSLQGGALAVEDSALLAKLFSHLRSAEQIPSFLYAFQELREGRCASVVKCEQGNLLFQMMPNGPQQEERDNMLRNQFSEGRQVLSCGEPLNQWEQVKELFGYDPEDQADDWWVKWGLLREHAKDRTKVLEERMSSSLYTVLGSSVTV